MPIYLIYGAIGLVAGVCSGLFGIGGGIIIVPLLVLLVQIPQQTAVGMSLMAMVIPLGAAIAAHEYYTAGKLAKHDLICSVLIAAGLACGAFLGARLGLSLPETVTRRVFAVFLIAAALRLWFQG